MSLIKLYVIFLQIGLFSFGGGLASLPLIHEQLVVNQGWISGQEFSDLIVIAQMTPGPIALNAATFIGMKLFGPEGAIVATLGFLTMPITIVSILTWLYFRYKNLHHMQWVLWGLRPAIIAFIASAGFAIFKMAFEDSLDQSTFHVIKDFLLIGLGLFLIKKYKMTPIKLIPLIGVIGAVLTYYL